MIKTLVGTIVIASASPAISSNELVERGQALYSTCATCHRLSSTGNHGVGPNLHGVYGRAIGSIDGFKFTPAMAAAGANGKVWDETSLDKLLANPGAYIPGTAMPGRVADASDRKALITFLKSGQRTDSASGKDSAVDEQILSIKGDPEYGEYLASECVTCHQADGSNKGIPPITGWPIDGFVTVMHAYKNKVRSNPVMQGIAGALGDEEIAALAAWFTTQKR